MGMPRFLSQMLVHLKECLEYIPLCAYGLLQMGDKKTKKRRAN